MQVKVPPQDIITCIGQYHIIGVIALKHVRKMKLYAY